MPQNDEPDGEQLAAYAIETRNRARRDPTSWLWPTSVLGAFISCAFGVGVGFTNYNARLDQMQSRLNFLEKKCVLLTELRSWVTVTGYKNPTLTLPDPKDFVERE